MTNRLQRKLLLAIARCSYADVAFRGEKIGRPCTEVVGTQNCDQMGFHLPEPWSGDLAAAPLLFLGSNPGFARREVYPLWSWEDDEIVDFFVHRFGAGRKVWVKGGLYPLLQGGSYKVGWVRYWAAIRRRAMELLDRNLVRPGVDYAMSEVVHCKSAREKGVASAFEVCVPLYLEKLVAVSGAKVVVCLGKVADRAVREKWGIPIGVAVYGPLDIGGRPRHFAFLPHPNARQDRSFAQCLHPHDLQRLRVELRAD